MITYATVCSTEMPVSGFGTDIGIFLMKTRMNKKEISMIKKIAAVMLSVCMSTAMVAGVQAADFTSGEETLEGTFTDGSKDDQTGDISEIANDIVAQAEEKAQEYQKLKEEADRVAAKKAAEERARKAEEERVAHRQEIVDFAMQFEGNPYVYGGTSLTNGADCSGFVQSVYAHFGVNLPRKKPMIAVCIAGGIGGMIAGASKASALSFAFPSIATIPVFFGKGFSLFLLSCLLGFVIAFVATMFLKFDADLSTEAQTK